MKRTLSAFIIFLSCTVFPVLAFSSENSSDVSHEAVHSIYAGWAPMGIVAIIIFVLSYGLVLAEEYSHMRKSKPVMLGAGLIWICIGIIAPSYGVTHDDMHAAIMHGLEEFAALMLFLLAAMTYISSLEDRKVFEVLKDKLVQAGLSLRQLFWATGIIAFFLSPIADNMTTSLVMGAVVMAVAGNDKKFITLACVNIVCAANAGGAFSPFGDITTLMVWQAGNVEFFEFFALFLPSVACFIVPATIMSFFVSTDKPAPLEKNTRLRYGAKTIIALGIFTIAMAISLEQFFGLPPFLGMMTGMSLLMIHAWFVRHHSKYRDNNYNIIDNVAAAEWDTLLFFFGVIFSVSGLAFLGYLELMSNALYGHMGDSVTNIILGVISALIDNIPIMFAVLTMDPQMDHFQWLLITLTAGVGGSLLSIGSAAGVALMGTARGKYTFFGHLKWTPVIALGYAAGIAVHFMINSHLMGTLSGGH
ncbi:MAG: sodium:proton antiporter NhaD [Alphaproteobacteria bacterium]|nr:sodium:proton antiporter NhaD [Alphaproteobacteria bacterium]